MELKKDLKNKKVYIKREFNAPVEEVWKAWTDSEITDQWWAPKPWKTKTKSVDFTEGGTWLYSMVGPNGEGHFCRADYKTIVPNKRFIVVDSFCDEDGNVNKEFPVITWDCKFEKSDKGTMVNMELSYESEADIEKVMEMGFKDGFESALGNLDELFEKQYH